MVTGPPQSGKTSLLQLLHEAAADSPLFLHPYYVNLEEHDGSLEQGLAQQDTSWDELFNRRLGMPTRTCPSFPLHCAVCCSAKSCCGAACRQRQINVDYPPSGWCPAAL